MARPNFDFSLLGLACGAIWDALKEIENKQIVGVPWSAADIQLYQKLLSQYVLLCESTYGMERILSDLPSAHLDNLLKDSNALQTDLRDQLEGILKKLSQTDLKDQLRKGMPNTTKNIPDNTNVPKDGGVTKKR